MQTAKTLIRLGRCPGWSESSLGKLILLVLSCHDSFHVESGFAPCSHFSRISRMPRLIWVFAGCTPIFLVLSCHDYFMLSLALLLVLISLASHGCPGWSESSLGAHPFFWFCHVMAHFMLSLALLLVLIFSILFSIVITLLGEERAGLIGNCICMSILHKLLFFLGGNGGLGGGGSFLFGVACNCGTHWTFLNMRIFNLSCMTKPTK